MGEAMAVMAAWGMEDMVAWMEWVMAAMAEAMAAMEATVAMVAMEWGMVGDMEDMAVMVLVTPTQTTTLKLENGEHAVDTPGTTTRITGTEGTVYMAEDTVAMEEGMGIINLESQALIK